MGQSTEHKTDNIDLYLVLLKMAAPFETTLPDASFLNVNICMLIAISPKFDFKSAIET